jgi:hypothetical protein
MAENVAKGHAIAIADSKLKYVFYACVCWALVIAGFFTFGAKERHWQFWMAESVMLSFGFGLLYMLLNKKYHFIGRSGDLYDKWMEEEHQLLLAKDGIFSYTAQGFVFQPTNEAINFGWNSIQSITARVEDELSNDDNIVLRIEDSAGKFIEFDEEVEGWIKWESQCRMHFPSIPDNWIDRLVASNTKETVLYKKSDTIS